jgi:glycogen(starch) synthase
MLHERLSPALRPLWLTETYPPSRGGMAQSCDRIVHALRSLGVAVDLVHLDRRPVEPRISARRQGRDFLWPVDGDGAHALRCLWNCLEGDAERGRITHVVAFGGLLPLLAGPAFAAWLPAPLVTLIRGNDLDIGLFHPQRADIVHRALARSARVCTVSSDKARQIAALLPDARPPAVIPSGIDLDRWRPLPADLERAAAWRRTIPAGRRVLGFFGHVKPKKGGLFFLDTLLRSGLAGRFHVRFVGELDDEVTAWLAGHGAVLSHTVEPFADRYQLLDRYPACDLVVLPSFYDGTPNVMVEAVALGVPILAARTGGMADLLQEGRHAFLFAPGSEEELGQAVHRAASAADVELARMGDACRELARSRLDHRREAEDHVQVLVETAERRAAAGAEPGKLRPPAGEAVSEGVEEAEATSEAGAAVATRGLPAVP